MKTNKKILIAALIVTYIFIVFLIGITFALPWLVTWYVETMGREQTLPTIIMLACYPCVPFAFFILTNTRKLIKNLIKDEVFTEDNAEILRKISILCLCISGITLIGTFFYMPFFIVFLGTGFFSLAATIIRNIIQIGTKE